jgi:predicted O-methyltransferase YrrM
MVRRWVPASLRHQVLRLAGVSSAEANRLRARIGELETTDRGLRQSIDHLQALLDQHTREVANRDAQIAELQADNASLLRGNTEWVTNGHYYSAVPSVAHLQEHRARVEAADKWSIPAVNLNLDGQWRLLDELAPLVESVPFPDQPVEGYRYHFENEYYAYTDGLFLSLMLQRFRPERVIEIGSGFSSAAMLDTADRFPPGPSRFTFVEPYPERLRTLLRKDDQARAEVVEQGVQYVPVAHFAELGADDLLLIDSTHTVKYGGDVNYLFFEVLPALQPGVIVHIHDIFPGFEYPWQWLEQRRAWAEAYLLRAFLQFNDAFEILLWPGLIAPLDLDDWTRRFRWASGGGSIYLRRR